MGLAVCAKAWDPRARRHAVAIDHVNGVLAAAAGVAEGLVPPCLAELEAAGYLHRLYGWDALGLDSLEWVGYRDPWASAGKPRPRRAIVLLWLLPRAPGPRGCANPDPQGCGIPHPRRAAGRGPAMSDRRKPPGRPAADRPPPGPFRFARAIEPKDVLRALLALDGLSSDAKVVLTYLHDSTFAGAMACWFGNARIERATRLPTHRLRFALVELEERRLVFRLFQWDDASAAALAGLGFEPPWPGATPRRALVLLWRLPPGTAQENSPVRTPEAPGKPRRKRPRAAPPAEENPRAAAPAEVGAGANFKDGAGAIPNMAPAPTANMAPAPSPKEASKVEASKGIPERNGNVPGKPSAGDGGTRPDEAALDRARQVRSRLWESIQYQLRLAEDGTIGFTRPASVPAQAIPPDLLAELRDTKPALLAILKSETMRSAAPAVAPPAAGGVAAIRALADPVGPEAVDRAVRAIASGVADFKPRTIAFLTEAFTNVRAGVLTTDLVAGLYQTARGPGIKSPARKFCGPLARELSRAGGAQKPAAGLRPRTPAAGA